MGEVSVGAVIAFIVGALICMALVGFAAWRLGKAHFEAAAALSEELRAQIGNLGAEKKELQERLLQAESDKAKAETGLKNSEQNLADQRTQLEQAQVRLPDTFKALATEALAGNNASFLALAEQKFSALQESANANLESRQKAIGELLKPLQDRVIEFKKAADELEQKRQNELGSLGRHLQQIALGQQQLGAETAKLTNALSSSQSRGNWGQIKLRRIVELAGMTAHCDFDEQVHVGAEDGRLRPDMVVRLPAGRDIVVDSKVPFDAYREHAEAVTEDNRIAALDRHAGHVKQHVKNLASKAYWSQFPGSLEFVVLFMPNDAFLSAAAERDPELVEWALRQRIVIATPSSLFALLLAIEYGWRQEHVALGAQEISALGREMSDRIVLVAEHFGKIGKALDSAVDAHDAALKSLESRLSATARRFKQLGAGAQKEVPELQPLGRLTRRPQSLPVGDPNQP
ncbi:MAG: DNA recombination protein RmuC [Candidatus Lambdaproteobacteria bacterium]|nr:DNA recombination protein RmuC [Candidatus Lambdaproteobacteria bacterium]